jgi:hypothetical protein
MLLLGTDGFEYASIRLFQKLSVLGAVTVLGVHPKGGRRRGRRRTDEGEANV